MTSEYDTPLPRIKVEGDILQKVERILADKGSGAPVPDEIEADPRMIHLFGIPYHYFTFMGEVVATQRYVPSEADIEAANRFLKDGFRRAGMEVED